MNRKIKGGLLAIAGVGLVASMSACGSNVQTPVGYTALHYSGGATSGAKFEDCVAPGTFRSDGFGDSHYLYPTGNQRTYDASDDKAAEQPPITVLSSDNQELKVPVGVTFHLNSDCQVLRQFHEKIGARNNAFWIDPSSEDEKPEGNAGWLAILRFYIGKQLDTGLDREAQSYGWQKLWNDPATKSAMEAAMQTKLQGLVDGFMGAEQGKSFFVIETVRIQKPEPTNPQLRENIAAAQAAVAKADTAKAEADAQKAAAEAQVAVAKAQAAQVQEQIKVLGKDGYLATLDQQNKEKAIEKGLNPYPSPIVAGVGQR